MKQLGSNLMGSCGGWVLGSLLTLSVAGLLRVRRNLQANGRDLIKVLSWYVAEKVEE
jgi:hypothetical protein